MEKINDDLVESTNKDTMVKLVPSMIETLLEIHKVKSEYAGNIIGNNDKRSWKEVFTSKFNGKDIYFDWHQIVKRELLDERLILFSIDKLIQKCEKVVFPKRDYSLLHTDFNQRNLFCKDNKINGVIDWGEAIYGDPIYDFARIRMFIWHFNLGDECIQDYYDCMKYSENDRELDDLFWIARVIEYLAYYSEDLVDFNIARIKLHQKFLESVWI